MRKLLCIALSALLAVPAAAEAKEYPLRKWDVITRIGDAPLDSRGQVAVREDLRLSFQDRQGRPGEGHRVPRPEDARRRDPGARGPGPDPAAEDVLADEGIRKQCSDDLEAVWRKK
jgi:hypothetical protein